MFSFSAQKKTVELQIYLRRICDLAVANRLVPDDDRSVRRCNCAVPVVLCPWSRNGPEMDKCMTVVTKDISDREVSLLLHHPLVEIAEEHGGGHDVGTLGSAQHGVVPVLASVLHLSDPFVRHMMAQVQGQHPRTNGQICWLA